MESISVVKDELCQTISAKEKVKKIAKKYKEYFSSIQQVESDNTVIHKKKKIIISSTNLVGRRKRKKEISVRGENAKNKRAKQNSTERKSRQRRRRPHVDISIRKAL